MKFRLPLLVALCLLAVPAFAGRTQSVQQVQQVEAVQQVQQVQVVPSVMQVQAVPQPIFQQAQSVTIQVPRTVMQERQVTRTVQVPVTTMVEQQVTETVCEPVTVMEEQQVQIQVQTAAPIPCVMQQTTCTCTTEQVAVEGYEVGIEDAVGRCRLLSRVRERLSVRGISE